MKYIGSIKDTYVGGEISAAAGVAGGCFLRLLKSFQATITLCELGLTNEAANQARAALETAIILGFLEARPEEMVERLKEENVANKMLYLKALLYFEEVSTEPNAEYMTHIKAQMEAIRSAYGGKAPRDIKIGDIATKWNVGLSLYKGPYRVLSAFGSHATITALNALFKDDADDGEPSFVFGIVDTGLSDVLAYSCGALIHGFGIYQDMLQHKATDDRIEGLLAAWRKYFDSAMENSPLIHDW